MNCRSLCSTAQVEVRASAACTWLGFLFVLTGSCCGHCATGHPCKLPSEGGGCCCCVSFFVSCKQAALKACASCWCIPFMWYGLCTCGGGHMQRIPGGVALTLRVPYFRKPPTCTVKRNCMLAGFGKPNSLWPAPPKPESQIPEPQMNLPAENTPKFHRPHNHDPQTVRL